MPVTRDASGRFASDDRFMVDFATLLSGGSVTVTNSPTATTPRCGRGGCALSGCQRTESDFDADGYDSFGYDRAGFDCAGFDREGRDREGFDTRGFSAGGVHRNCDSYDDDGYNMYGRDRDGYNMYGRDREGRDRFGYDRTGLNRDGFDAYGYDATGYDSGGYDRQGYSEDGYDRDGDYHERCGTCDEWDCDSDHGEDNYGYDRSLHGYSYTPTLQFMGEGTAHYGMEIEVTLDRVNEGVDLVSEHAGTLANGSDLIWCKHDSSVDGMEMVTHPMTYEWAMKNFPWKVLSDLRDKAGATVIGQENGIHVHVSRKAFDNSAHLYRWFKLWYRNPNDMQRIARRRSNSWGSFDDRHRESQKDHVKFGKPGYDSFADKTGRNRYSAINTQNAATLEVRIFASSLRPQRVKAALQLVAASVEYTRQLTADDITHRRGWDWRAFMAWVRRNGAYPDLVAEDRTRRY